MKKLLLLLSWVVVLNANAQLAPYSVAPDFTSTDLNGVSHNLQSYLDAGKTVIMDVSATWCGPCWNFHNTGVLDDVYNTYGPNGTDEMMVFFVEGDGTTTTADLNGTGTNTQGDWVSGSAYPILDDASIATSYAINYFPTVYIICPAGIVWECGQAGPDGNYWTAEGLHSLIGDCPTANFENDPTLLQCNTPATSACGVGATGTITPEAFLMNLGATANLTAATIKTYKNGTLVNTNNWTGSLATYESAWVTLSPVTVSATDVVTCQVENADDLNAGNNEAPVNFNFTAIGSVVTSAPVIEGLEDSNFPANGWAISDVANDGTNWYWNDQGQFGLDGATLFDFFSAPSGQTDDFISPSLDLSGLTAAYCNFAYTKANYLSGAGNDKLQVRVSTNCGATWTTVWTKTSPDLDTEPATNSAYIPNASTEWATASVDLSQWAGQTDVLVAFRAVSGYGNLLHLDNINISAIPSNVNDVKQSFESSVYPNPSTGLITINGQRDTEVKIFDAMGNLVESVYMNNPVQSLNLDAYANGLYNVQLVHNGTATTHRVTIQK
jgi:hypothetical protein